MEKMTKRIIEFNNSMFGKQKLNSLDLEQIVIEQIEIE